MSQKLSNKKTDAIFKRLLKKRTKRSHKRVVRYSLLAANLALLLAVVGVVTYEPTSKTVTNQSVVTLSTQGDPVRANPLDQLSSADIAVHVALAADLDETVAVVNHADSVSAQMAVAPSDEAIAAKPQVVVTQLKSKKDIVVYTVKAGDSLASVAQAHGVTSDSIRWSNNLGGDNLTAGQELVIPPVNGVVYTVKAGDTIESIARRFSANQAQLIADNDAEIGGLVVGERILIRGGIQPTTSSRYSFYSSFSFGANAVYGGNGYDYGWCTWHAANRRIQAGRPLPSNFGNAISWYYNAQRAGLPVGPTPQAGAVIWHANMGGLGHVAYVESVNPDGSILVSDMNFPIWGRVTYRTVSPGEFGSYRFIY